MFADRHDWSAAQIVTAYRSQWEVESAFRQLKDPHHAAFRPIYHWTDQKIKVHSLYSVAALMLVNLKRASPSHDRVAASLDQSTRPGARALRHRRTAHQTNGRLT